MAANAEPVVCERPIPENPVDSPNAETYENCVNGKRFGKLFGTPHQLDQF